MIRENVNKVREYFKAKEDELFKLRFAEKMTFQFEMKDYLIEACEEKNISFEKIKARGNKLTLTAKYRAKSYLALVVSYKLQYNPVEDDYTLKSYEVNSYLPDEFIDQAEEQLTRGYKEFEKKMKAQYGLSIDEIESIISQYFEA